MLDQPDFHPPQSVVTSVSDRPVATDTPHPGRSWARILRHGETYWVMLLLAAVGTLHAINMFNFPYFENDEGDYLSQAWAIIHQGQLAPYTYWYDHAPAGWILIALWTLLTGGFHTFGTSVATGRVFILVIVLASALMLYAIARIISRSAIVATLAVLLFALPVYAMYFQRLVLLDNIAVFWVLLSLLLLVQGKFTLTRVWLSALTLAIGVLTKENMLFLAPAYGYMVFWRAHKSQRMYALTGWLAVLASVGSIYVLMAVIKGELFPTGTWLGDNTAHVSLLGTLAYQASRGKDGGMLNLGSSFWQSVKTWTQTEPLLVGGGSVSAFSR